MESINNLMNNKKNDIFFNNAKFHSDYKYELLNNNEILRVFCKDAQGKRGHIVDYEIENGKICDKIEWFYNI